MNSKEAQKAIKRFYGSEAAKRNRFSGQMTAEFQTMLAEAHADLSIDDCYFYHTMEFSDGQVCEGSWDLRGGEREYLGYIDFTGQTVLELGPATGYLSFFMERMGAQVVCFDLAKGMTHEVLPLPGLDIAREEKNGIDFVYKTQNSWWYGHRKSKSNSRAVYGDIYRLPGDLGRFDISIFGCILLHLSNPFAVLRKIAAITEKAVIITDLIQRTPFNLDTSFLDFNPGGQQKNPVNWWGVSPGAVLKMLRMLGFPEISIYYHVQKYRLQNDLTAPFNEVKLFTIVGKRKPYSIRHLELTEDEKKAQLELERSWVWDPEAVLRAENQALRSSISWRITRPLRWLGKILRQTNKQ